MIDPEANVLGSILINPAAFWRCADLLTAEDFANGAHRKLWMLADMSREGGAIDQFTASEREPALERVIFDLTTTQATSANVRSYAEVVAKRALERRVVQAGQRIANLRGEGVLGEAQQILAECAPRASVGVRHVRDVIREAWSDLQERYEKKDAITGLATGVRWIDDLTSGLQPGDVMVLGARPSDGKTALMLQICGFAAETKPVLVFSAEMTDKALVNRMMASRSRVSLKAIRAPALIEDEGWTSLGAAVPKIRESNLFIDSSDGLSCEMMAARARQVKEQHGLALIAIDYLQLLKLPKADRHDLAVAAASRAIKSMAKALDVPVILLSQLSRDGANKRPTMDTLRESGAIEQDADVIFLLYRPDHSKSERELILAKQRNGEIGSQWYDFDGARQTFAEINAPQHDPQRRPRFG